MSMTSSARMAGFVLVVGFHLVSCGGQVAQDEDFGTPSIPGEAPGAGAGNPGIGGTTGVTSRTAGTGGNRPSTGVTTTGTVSSGSSGVTGAIGSGSQPTTGSTGSPSTPISGRSNCCEATAVPGCQTESTATSVCGKDPYCCTFAWDIHCVAMAASIGSCVPGGTATTTGSSASGSVAGKSPCCVQNSSAGCTDDPVRRCVCSGDAFCCGNRWDTLCVAEVTTFGCGKC